MAVHLEFVVLGPPISNQQSTPQGKRNLVTWRGTVLGEATRCWRNPPLVKELKAVIINFYDGNKPSVDVDNMSKPILDVMQNLVYDSDRQIIQAEISHVKIDAPFSIPNVRPIIVSALQAALQFVYVKIEDPTDPFALPK